jgi:hypothetical protein
MYNHKLVLEDQIYEEEMVFPDGGTVVTATGIRTGGQEGRLAFVIRVNPDIDNPIILHEDDILTVVFQQSDSESTGYAVVPVTQANGVPSHVITATGGNLTYALGATIMRGLIPLGLKKWTKISLTCDDAAMDANDLIDVFVEYLAN